MIRSARAVPACTLVLMLAWPLCADQGQAQRQQREVSLAPLPERLLPEQVTVSADGRRFAWVARRGVKVMAVVNGVPSKPYDWIVRSYVGFTSDSRHVIYQVRRSGKMFTVIDGVEGKEYDSVDNWICSPAGGRVGYVARRGAKFLPVIDGVEGKEYDSVRIAALAALGKTALIVEIAGRDCIVVDGVEGRMYPHVVDARLSPDGKRLACRILRNETSASMVVDGTPGKTYPANDGAPAIEPAEFSQDGSRFGYVAGAERERILVVDGAEIATPGGKIVSGPVFSADGKRLAYVVSKAADAAAVIVDAIEGKTYDSVGQVRFSPDGKRVAYVATKASRTMVVLDGAEIGQYQAVAADSITFSGDGHHIAWVARRADKEYVVTDGTESQPYDRILVGDGLRFADDASIHAIAVRYRLATRQGETGPVRVRELDLFGLDVRIAQ